MSRPIISPLSAIHKSVYERSLKILKTQYTGIPTAVNSVVFNHLKCYRTAFG